MRGDWLYYKGRFNAFPFQVEQITKKKIGYHAEPEDNRIYYLESEECFPFHLTEEIINRNFKVNKFYQRHFGSSLVTFYTMPTLKYIKGDWNFIWVKREDEEYLIIEDDPTIRIKYIHELQHLFKLCHIDKKIQL